MKFERTNQSGRTITSRDIRRVVRLVMLLILILAAMKATADPEFWSWMFPERGQVDAEQNPSRNGGSADLQFVEPAPIGKPRPSENIPQADDERAQVDTNASAEETPAVEDSDDPLELFPADLAQDIQDDTLGVRQAEAEAYYTTLRRLRKTSHGELESHGREDITYDVLMGNSERLRGTPITLHGHLRRLEQSPESEHRPAGGPLFDGWIFTRDSGNEPYHVMATDVGDNVPPGADLDPPVPVQVTGIFFKREGYESRGGLNVAPLLLAKRIELIPSTPGMGVESADSLTPYIAGFAVFLIAIVCLMAWRTTAGDRKSRRQRQRNLLAAPDELPPPADTDNSEAEQ